MQSTIKYAANSLALWVTFPAFVFFLTSSLVVGKRRAFVGLNQLFCLWPGITGEFMRRGLFRWLFAEASDSMIVSFGTVFSHHDCRLGQHVYIGPFCSLGAVTIQDDVLIGSHVSVPNGAQQHGIGRLDIPVREQPGTWTRIHIGRDSWIGDRAIVMADVGCHCVVGAGAVVTKRVEDYAIVVGNPARIVGYRKQTSEMDADPTRNSECEPSQSIKEG